MSLKSLVDNAVVEIGKSASTPLTKSETAAISRIIEKSMIEAVRQSSKSCTTAAVVCCGPEADLAHQITEEVKRAQHVLITNLMAMR